MPPCVGMTFHFLTLLLLIYISKQLPKIAIFYIRAHIDTSWLSFIITPPHPEYPAAHAMITSSVMQAMNTVFGYNYHFTDHTYDFLGYPTRSYNSFEQAALECGMSRVYGGIHYLPSVDIAHVYGRYIGEQMALIRLTDNHW